MKKPVGTITINTEENDDWLKGLPQAKGEIAISKNALKKPRKKLKLSKKGGSGSGNFGHTGRPGMVGGSGGSGGGRLSMQEVEPDFIDGGDPSIKKRYMQEVWDWGDDRGDIGIAAVANLATGDGFIFRNGNEVVGVASTYVNTKRGYIMVNYLATKRPGVGRAAMAHIARAALESNLTVNLAPSSDAYGFYSKLGFVEHSRVRTHMIWTTEAMENYVNQQSRTKEIDDEPENGVFVGKVKKPKKKKLRLKKAK